MLRVALLFLALIHLFPGPCLSADPQMAPKSPNLIILMADDLGYGDLGCTGSPQIPTPHIDSLAKEGVFCSRAYVTAPMCAPSRMGLLTGRFPKRYGITTNPNIKTDYLPESHYGLPQTETILPGYLKKRGYTSAVIGKWHLGHTPGYLPADRGFDTWWGFLGGSRPYFPLAREQKGLNPSAITSNYTAETGISYLTDDIARECVRFIENSAAGRPYFLFASFNAPHWPMEATKEDLELFKNITPKPRAVYCAMVHALDRAVGNILKALDNSNQAENTIVIFLSDNGGAPYSPSCNAPLKGEKRLHYEGGVRVPMIVRYPADKNLKPGSVCGQVVSTLDILPAMLETNGLPLPRNLDGMNLLPLLSMAENKTPRTLYWCTDCTSALLEGDLKYLLVPDRAPQLYNIGQDCEEIGDLYRTAPDKAAPLAKKLGSYLTSTPACRYPDAISWSTGLLKQYDEARPHSQSAKDKTP